MEGTLWKWTNYFSGWQSRWFVLENGILSYYKSQEDVVNGCKGSIKMSVCDVNVHGTDMSRLDLIIPGEAHFYVRAASPQERQQWLVALGSAKACLTNGKPANTMTISVEIPEEQLKVKRSELRLYCDLLMQQVHSVKSAVLTSETPSVTALNEATSLLTATCDTFIQTLEDCMTMASAQTTLDPSLSPEVQMSSPNKKTAKSVPWNGGTVRRSISVDSSVQNGHSEDELIQGYIPSTLKGHRGQKMRPGNRSISETSEYSSDTSPPKEMSPASTLQELKQTLNHLDPDQIVPTFFSSMPYSFKDVKYLEHLGIPTASFLDACKPILPIFDKLNPTAFAPVKLDISGNIRKIQQKFSSDPDRFQTLQSIVEYEVTNKQNTNPNSATVALLWLKRGLQFIELFLQEYLLGVDDLGIAANTAYGKTLKPYHSWVVRGVFALAVKAVPTKEEFLQHMSECEADTTRPTFRQCLLRDMEAYVSDIRKCLKIIHEYYTVHDLDSDEQV